MTRDELALLALLKAVYRDAHALERALIGAYPQYSHLLVDNLYLEAPKNQVFFEAVQQLHATGLHADAALYARLERDAPGRREDIAAVYARYQPQEPDVPDLDALTFQDPIRGGGAPGTVPGGSIVYDDAFDWDRADARALFEALHSGWPRRADAASLLAGTGVDASIPDELDHDPWRLLLPRAAAAGALARVVQAAIEDDDPGRALIRGQLLGFVAQDRPVVTAPQDLPPLLDGQPEAQVTRSDNLRPIWFLDLARSRSRSICQVRVRGSAGQVKGTGFVIGPRRILTNHHVLHGAGDVHAVSIWLDHELTAEGRPVQAQVLDGDVGSICSSTVMQGPLEERVDWATIDTRQPIPGAYPPLALARGGRILQGERCYIVHHPAGGEKQITLQGNHVRYAGDRVLQYLTHTEKGSSGAPVFDERWNVVGVHYAGGTLVDPDTHARVHRNMGVWLDAILDDPAFPGDA